MADLFERQRGLRTTYHPKSPDASLERLRQLAGIIELKGPVPSHKFLEDDEDDEDEDGPAEHARD